MEVLTQAEIEDRLRDEELNTWLELWRVEQGPAKPGALKLMAAAIPFPVDQSLRVLDVGCGPGDAGRAIHSRFVNAQVDFVDRDLFFVSLCAAVNRRYGIRGRTLARDLLEPDWRHDFSSDYDVVVAVNSIHWFTQASAAKLLHDIFELLRSGGAFVLMEPVGAEPKFASGFNAWQQEQPSQHKHEDWLRFWSKVNALLGHDYAKSYFGDRPDHNIGDRLSVMGWISLLENAGFKSIDVLLRDPEKAVLASLKP